MDGRNGSFAFLLEVKPRCADALAALLQARYNRVTKSSEPCPREREERCLMPFVLFAALVVLGVVVMVVMLYLLARRRL
jgi:hypothetical protein